MRNYYYLAISLPDLEIENKPTIHFKELIEQFEINLSPSDFKKLNKIRLYFDLVNLEKYLQELEVDFRGSLSAFEISEALEFKIYYPEYVFDFLENFKTKEERLLKFPLIFSKYFQEFDEDQDEIKNIVIFENELRLFLLGYRAIRFHKSIEEEFQFENLSQDTVDMILSQQAETKVIDESKLQYLIEDLKKTNDPLEVRSLVESFRFEHYKEIQDLHPFTIVGIIAYMMQLKILEDLEVKHPEIGLKILHDLLKE